MSRLSALRVAVVVTLLSVVAMAAGLVFLSLTWSQAVGEGASSRSTFLVNLLSGAALLVVGAVITSRRPENAIGWIFLAGGAYSSLGGFSERYTLYGLVVSDEPLPGAAVLVALGSGAWIVALLVVTSLLVLFPRGRLPSRRWATALQAATACGALAMVLLALQPGPFPSPFDSISNPLGVEEAEKLMVVAFGCIALLFSLTLAAVVSVIGRFRASTGFEREQFKWFAYAVSFVPLFLLLHSIADAVLPEAVNVIETGFGLVSAGIPVAVGVAILRYRLYDIDRIINRTLVYGLLTAVLAALYFALVVGLQALFRPISGSSDLAIALTTLIVAALFLPVRQRLQTIVDRRFNRRAYDAARTVDAFAARLRQNIDLDTLRYELLTVVDETMEPSRVALWLRGGAPGKGEVV